MNAAGQRTPPVIGVLPLGGIDARTCGGIADQIAARLCLVSLCLPGRPYPGEAFDRRRMQFDAVKIVRSLQSIDTASCDKVVALIDADICLPIFTHVFGEAGQGGKMAVVSSYRLTQPDRQGRPPAAALQKMRLTKVALHELGHLFDLVHCDNPACIMHFSADLAALDAVALSFCRYCRVYLNDAGIAVK